MPSKENEITSTEKVTCINCGKVYLQEKREQIAGFRIRSYDRCPYCEKEAGWSMQWEYTNYKI